MEELLTVKLMDIVNKVLKIGGVVPSMREIIFSAATFHNGIIGLASFICASVSGFE